MASVGGAVASEPPTTWLGFGPVSEFWLSGLKIVVLEPLRRPGRRYLRFQSSLEQSSPGKALRSQNAVSQLNADYDRIVSNLGTKGI